MIWLFRSTMDSPPSLTARRPCTNAQPNNWRTARWPRYPAPLPRGHDARTTAEPHAQRRRPHPHRSPRPRAPSLPDRSDARPRPPPSSGSRPHNALRGQGRRHHRDEAPPTQRTLPGSASRPRPALRGQGSRPRWFLHDPPSSSRRPNRDRRLINTQRTGLPSLAYGSLSPTPALIPARRPLAQLPSEASAPLAPSC